MCKPGIRKIIDLPKKDWYETNLHDPVLISERKKIKVDACLAPLVQMLNDYGVKTIACCCGHGETVFSWIRISSQNIDLIPMGDEMTIHLKFRYRGKKERKKVIDFLHEIARKISVA